MTRGYEPAGFVDAIEGTTVPSEYYDNKDAWDNWYEQAPPFTQFVPGLGEVTLIDIEGDDFTTLIFKLVTIDGVTQYFRKEGWVDGYSYERKWDGVVVEIEPEATHVVFWKDK
jgi:hypothetical protein